CWGRAGAPAPPTGRVGLGEHSGGRGSVRLERRRVGIVGWCEFEIRLYGLHRAFAWPDLGFKIVCGRRAFGFERLAERRSGLGSVRLERSFGRRNVGTVCWREFEIRLDR